ncbi:M15 family metallopeptidase [Candidatus Saccharibacteria bacterium]|nr:M15 family metallopeptidase [Candidatus Saccharibacteria bacterium]
MSKKGKIGLVVLTILLSAALFIACVIETLISKTNNYLILVNKTHELPKEWLQTIQIDTVKNSLGEEVQIERNTYLAYCGLRDELLAQGVQIELDSVYRSIEDQKETWDWFIENYGEEYTKSHISPPGYSEHHTGLAVDIFIIKDGKEIRENEDMVADVEDFEKIHTLMPEYGFILRYLPGKENITGYSYEPWHMRYIGSDYLAERITKQGLTLEEFLSDPH